MEAEGPRRYPQRAKPTALSPAQLAHVERRLTVCPAIRGTDLFAELQRDYRFAGSYPSLQRQLRALRPAAVREPVVRFETAPGLQTQADWAHIGRFPLGDELVELHTMVVILGCSRAPAIRFATNCTRRTTIERLVSCLDDLGGVIREVLTDRDPAFCIGSTSDGRAILAPEWVDTATLLGTVPKACRPYRAQTKGGGFVADSGFSGRGDQQTATLTLRVPAGQFDSLVNDLRGAAKEVVAITTGSQDVTGEITDLESQLRNLHAVESQYLGLLGRAQSIAEILQVQDRLNQTRLQIDRTQGRIQLLQRLSDLASLQVSLRPAAVGASGGGSPLDAVREAWQASLGTLAASRSWRWWRWCTRGGSCHRSPSWRSWCAATG